MSDGIYIAGMQSMKEQIVEDLQILIYTFTPTDNEDVLDVVSEIQVLIGKYKEE